MQRWVKFTKYLSRQGWECIVYTPENPEQLALDESLVAEVDPAVTVIKRPIREPYGIYRKLFKPKEKGTGVNPVNSQQKSFSQRLALRLRGNLFVPDPRCGWIKPSARYLCKYLKDNPVDTIITTGPPHSMHLIGQRLHKSTGIRWIADFRDPWTEMFSFKHLGLYPWTEARHRKLESQVIREADAVISVSPPVRDDFAARTQRPVYLLTNGYDAEDFAGTPPPLPVDTFTIVHTGLFASDGNPLKLWDVLARKCETEPLFRQQLRIRLSGKTDPEIIEALRSRGLGDNVVNLGYLPHNETVSEQRSASLLILPLRQEPEYAKVLPGKIFEYLAARRPVLGIGQESGAAATMLREAQAGDMYDWEETEPVSAFIDACWKRHLSRTEGPCTGNIERYSREEISRRLAEIL